MQTLHADWNTGTDEGDFDRGENEDIENAFVAACARLSINPRTGEVIDCGPATGMTQVDEKTVRQLDAGAGGAKPA